MANIHELRQERLSQIKQITDLGLNPYEQKVNRTHQAKQLLDKFVDLENSDVTIAGRITSIRVMGGVSFVDVTDTSGKIQAMIRKSDIELNTDNNQLGFKELRLLSNGDFIEVSGSLGLTKTEEKTVFAKSVRLLSKSIRPLPDRHEGLKNIETRYRQRYVDLQINEDVKKVIDTRIKIIKSFRNYLDQNGFVEIETPILQPVYGGASARPFTTYHHKLESDLYLRIADELYLKRAIIAGYEKVYEIGHDFRNEGIDPAHNPEFTMLEFYWAYADYEDLMTMTENMLEKVCMDVLGTTKISYQDQEFDFKAPYERISFNEAIKRETGVDIENISREELLEKLKEQKVNLESDNPPMKDLVDEFFKATTRPHLKGPLFLTDYPAIMKPLAKTKPGDEAKSASMQLVINGEEILNAYNELNDPEVQFSNWQKEQKVLDAGESEEAQPIDYDFVRALEYGMPPTAGWGMGIDRITQILTDQPSVKDTIIFPTLRREEFDESEFTYEKES